MVRTFALLGPALALAALVALAGCEEDLSPTIDPFPISVDRSSGSLAMGARTNVDALGDVPMVLDTLTPLSVIDTYGGGGGEVPAPRRLRTSFEIISAGATPIGRARYESVTVIDVHPCQTAGAVCRVGLEPLEGGACGSTPGPNTAEYRAILGGDLLSRSAVRLDFRDAAAPAIQFFPDIAGDSPRHCRAGLPVISTPLSGGSTIQIEGGEVRYTPNRLPLNVCAEFDPEDSDTASGTDFLMLLATGIGPSVMSETAYGRYVRSLDAVCTADATRCDSPDDDFDPPVPYDLLPNECLQLPSGPTVARVHTLRRLAVVGDGNSDENRGPCEERRANVIMAGGGCDGDVACPCKKDGDLLCRADAIVELEPEVAIPIAVLPDSHPLLQALREELRPGQAEVDGVLGLSALTALRLDLDYPGSRVLFRCEDEVTSRGRRACTPRTEVFDEDGTSPADRCPDPP